MIPTAVAHPRNQKITLYHTLNSLPRGGLFALGLSWKHYGSDVAPNLYRA